MPLHRLGKGAGVVDEPFPIATVSIGLGFAKAHLFATGHLEIPGLLRFAIPGFRKQHNRSLQILADPKGSVNSGQGVDLAGVSFTALLLPYAGQHSP